ncbi:MAG: hypothetical protein ANABAC_2972 [Anaerolineae bacterium]|jgi:hypothetical protein|nr:MAG: hypothetical protein ANABAC_2972 [Anaerolineae bacterium]
MQRVIASAPIAVIVKGTLLDKDGLSSPLQNPQPKWWGSNNSLSFQQTRAHLL